MMVQKKMVYRQRRAENSGTPGVRILQGNPHRYVTLI
jgi:hypothetical protein